MGGRAVVVFGGANLDVLARSTAPVIGGTSNPGRVTRTPGGVGRNVAENLARLGTPVHLVAAVGDDDAGVHLCEQTRTAGVDVDLVRRVRAATGSYTAVIDTDGELIVAVADMRAADLLTPDHVAAAAEAVAAAALVVVDANLSTSTVAAVLALAAGNHTPVVLEPVSVPKAHALAPVLARAAENAELTVTPNQAELGALAAALAPHAAGVRAGEGATDPRGRIGEQVELLHEHGIPRVWVRLGRDGSLLSTPSGTTRHPCVDAEVVDATGAGDAMLAAYCHALLGGASPQEAVAYAQAAAAVTVADARTVRRDLSDALVRSLL